VSELTETLRGDGGFGHTGVGGELDQSRSTSNDQVGSPEKKMDG
jgi:hypothetical protein